MTREGTRLTATLIVAVLAAALLVACGDSSDSDSGSNGATTEANGQAGDGVRTFGSDAEEGGSPPASTAFDGYEREEVEVPLKVSGGGSEQFLEKGGDNSIAEFGEEADEGELQEAAETVHDFYIARATGEWSEACTHISASLSKQLEQLASKSEVKGCAPFLEAFTTKQPAKVWRELNTIDAASLRHEGEQAFLMYIGAKDEVFAMPLIEEDGEWKVGSLAASPIGPVS